MDILNKYKKTKLMKNINLIGISLLIAFGINFVIFNSSSENTLLKANILENEKNINLGDIYLENEIKENKILLKTKGNINNITSFSTTIFYNPDNLSIIDIIPKLNGELQKFSSEPGIMTIILNYNDVFNIKKLEKIISIKYKKKQNTTETINLMNTNFTNSKGETFELTTSGISF